MTLTGNFNDPLYTTETVDNNSINLNSLYCSHLWRNSNLRNGIINASCRDKNTISYCYTCKGKIRKYEIKSERSFTPYNHSTPNKEDRKHNDEVIMSEQIDTNNISQVVCSNKDSLSNIAKNVDSKQCIPSISQRIDSSFKQKYVSYESAPYNTRRQRRSKNIRGFGCIVNFTSTNSSLKKSTQIQACSISVMIVAIIIISIILVNFTKPYFKGVSSKISTTIVPTKLIDINETVSAITSLNSELQAVTENRTIEELVSSIEPTSYINTETTTITTIIAKIRKNIRMYPKDAMKEHNVKPKDVNNQELSKRFCSCQNNEICMLEESSGTSICRKPLDSDDPTGCGGLCALDTEACQLVDKTSGVRVCRLLTVTCSPHEWRCRNGLCVPMEARCNGSIQCYDRSDEMYCDCDLTKQFRCGHSISCFPNIKFCDGVIDCWDGYDELNCTTECPRHQFTCTSGQCILASRFCDGLADCEDGSDEPDGCGGNCGAHELRCGNNRCIPRTLHCDGHDDCGDATDEINCSKALHIK